ncbi:VOC family protein [Streptomyces sp. NPDC004539]|uniref:VOC family protein n=1 Tax=Streptomyces sp. NPDC004539 TaxID=3154280 RepID=UPI00339E9075
MQVLPHVDFFGTCEEAIEFYRTALGAKVESLSRYSDLHADHEVPEELGHKVHFATLRIGEGLLTCGDVMLEPIDHGGHSILLVVDSPEQAQHLSDALSSGDGTVHFDLRETSGGDQAAGVYDKFGVRWYFHVPTDD